MGLSKEGAHVGVVSSLRLHLPQHLPQYLRSSHVIANGIQHARVIVGTPFRPYNPETSRPRRPGLTYKSSHPSLLTSSLPPHSPPHSPPLLSHFTTPLHLTRAPTTTTINHTNMEDDHQSPPPAVDEAHVQEKHATEDSHHSLPPAVDDLTPQEHTAEDAHDAAVPLIVDEEPTLETIVAHLLARLDSHPHEATPKLLQALLNAAVTTAMNSNVARDVSVAGSEESMGDVSETPTAVEVSNLLRRHPGSTNTRSRDERTGQNGTSSSTVASRSARSSSIT
jgi:hypothetical protein